MAEAKHPSLTTGPLVDVSVQGSPRYAMRVIARLPLRGRDDGVALVTIRLPGDEELAQVIAAAPEMLEAAQAAWNCIAELSPTQARVETAQLLQAAIAKAAGSAA